MPTIFRRWLPLKDPRLLGIFLMMVVPVILLMTLDRVDPVVPHCADRHEMEEFLAKLGRSFPDERQQLLEFSAEKASLTLWQNLKVQQLHSLWIADVNNDGDKEYFWTLEAEGSGHYDSFAVYGENRDGTLFELNWPGLPNDVPLPSNLDSPPLVQEQKVTYLMFLDIWSENKQGEAVAGGSNCNAAPDVYCWVTVRMKCRWDKNGVTIVSTDKQRGKY
jgi:hypothetical protein